MQSHHWNLESIILHNFNQFLSPKDRIERGCVKTCGTLKWLGSLDQIWEKESEDERDEEGLKWSRDHDWKKEIREEESEDKRN